MEISFDDPVVEPGDGVEGRGTRRRLVGAVAAIALVTAAVGVGYGVGRTTDDTSADSATDVAERSLGAVTTDAAEPTVAPTVPDTVAEDRASSEPAVTEPASSYASDDVASSYMASGGSGYAAFGSQPMELLAERTTPSGFTLRVHLGEPWDDDPGTWVVNGWKPAPWCYEAGQMRVSLVGNGLVDVGGVPWYREPYNGRAVAWLSLGGVDGSPQWVVVTQTPVDTSSVTVTFGNGSTDTATPQNGIAVLTVPGEPAVEVDEGGGTYWMEPTPQFEVRFDGGTTPGIVTADGVGSWADDEFRSGCEPPPPPLPEPGEQPVDPPADEAQIAAVVEVLYDAEVGDGRDVHVDDPTGVADARAQVAEGPYGEQARSADVVIEELVFTAPTEAWFRYRIEAGTVFDNRFGVAVLLGGEWKITRDTVCQDLSLAGGDCGGSWRPVVPPGSDRPGG